MENIAITESKGMIAVLFDKVGDSYYLILNDIEGSWQLAKARLEQGTDPESCIIEAVGKQTGIRSLKLIQKLDKPFMLDEGGAKVSYDIYLIEASMNVPVILSKENPKFRTYLWATKGRVTDKLDDNQKPIIDASSKIISSL